MLLILGLRLWPGPRKAPPPPAEAAAITEADQAHALKQVGWWLCSIPHPQHPEWHTTYFVADLIKPGGEAEEYSRMYGFVGEIGPTGWWGWDAGPDAGWKGARGGGARNVKEAICRLIASYNRAN